MGWFGGCSEALSTARDAITLAREAKTIGERETERREAHERLCGERWERLRESVDNMRSEQDRKHDENKRNLAKLWWAIMLGMGVTICGMAGLIVTLTLRGHIQ